MRDIFLALFLLSILALIIGLGKPSLLKLKSRKKAGLVFGGSMIAFFILFGVASPAPATTPIASAPETLIASTTTTDTVVAIAPAKITPPPTSVPVAAPVIKSQTVVQSTSTPTYGVQTKTSGCVDGVLPDPACSPGAVLTTDIPTVCTVGYTKTVRDVSVATKEEVFAEYGISYSTEHSNYEVDHIISLEIGGSNDISNLYPESYLIPDGARVKDVFENYLHRQVCSGAMTIQEAQKEISTNWLQYATAAGEAK